MIQTSIIIPVFNKWDLTRNCLKSLAVTTNPETAEVIVLDNASTDPTSQGAPFLGKKLFGDSFVYVRNETNRNFAGASNQGARLAKGDWLVFLNNDTIPTSGWLEALLADFREFPGLAATGPLLTYGGQGLLGYAVQHLGVRINPLMKVAHLYAGIPAASPLARRRRFFQAITAACMCIPKKLFMGIGAFDEGYINGFEDLDLCARLTHDGWRMTVNSQSHVLHLESQSAGRHAFDLENSKRWNSGNLKFMHPDTMELLAADGLDLGISDWQHWIPKMPSAALVKLEELANSGKCELRSLLLENPYWENGWLRFARELPDASMSFETRMQAFELFKNPLLLLENSEDALKNGNRKMAAQILEKIGPYLTGAENYIKNSIIMQDYFRKENNAKIGALFENWTKNQKNFIANAYEPAVEQAKKLKQFCKK